jgi:hypothetical protein
MCSVIETVPCKTEPQMEILLWVKVGWTRLCVCIAGTKNDSLFCQREKRILHGSFIFPSKCINNLSIFLKYGNNYRK